MQLYNQTTVQCIIMQISHCSHQYQSGCKVLFILKKLWFLITWPVYVQDRCPQQIDVLVSQLKWSFLKTCMSKSLRIQVHSFQMCGPLYCFSIKWNLKFRFLPSYVDTNTILDLLYLGCSSARCVILYVWSIEESNEYCFYFQWK